MQQPRSLVLMPPISMRTDSHTPVPLCHVLALQVAAKDLTEKFLRLRDSKRQMQISRGRKPLSDSLNAGLMKNQDSMDVEMGPLDISPDLPPEWVDLVRSCMLEISHLFLRA